MVREAFQKLNGTITVRHTFLTVHFHRTSHSPGIALLVLAPGYCHRWRRLLRRLFAPQNLAWTTEQPPQTPQTKQRSRAAVEKITGQTSFFQLSLQGCLLIGRARFRVLGSCTGREGERGFMEKGKVEVDCSSKLSFHIIVDCGA
jgi:hypothetical protein